MKLWQYTATETHSLISRREVSCKEVVESHISRLDEVNPIVNAVPIRLAEQALHTASLQDNVLSTKKRKASEKNVPPLFGVPVTVKVNIDQIGQANSDGVTAFKNNVASADSPVITNVKEAGALIIGQTNTPEFSIRWFTGNDLHGLTLNPWDHNLTPGGSSGGASSAVVSGIGCIAHGNDMGGSLRYPAYCCGAYTIRPSFGRIANANPSTSNGRPPMSQLLSVQGPIARSIDDLILSLNVMSAPSSLDPDWQNSVCAGRPEGRGKKIAYQLDPFGLGVDPEVAKAIETARLAFMDAGYELEEVSLPEAMKASQAWGRITMAEVSCMMNDTLISHASSDIKQTIASMHTFFGPSDVKQLMQDLYLRNQVRLAWNKLFNEYAAVLMPVSASTPFSNNLDIKEPQRLRQILEQQRFAYLINYLGFPSVAIPTSVDRLLPVGVQVVGAPNDDFNILRISKALESRCVIDYKLLWAEQEKQMVIS